MSLRIAFRPIEMFAVLGRHEVRFVAIGGLAATLHGSPLTTGDLDICPAADRANLQRLAAALREIDARVYAISEPAGLAFSCDAETLSQARVWDLITRHGRLDLSFTPSGTQGYDDLRRDQVTYELHGVEFPTASLADVIRSKEAAGRERDRQALPTLRRLQEELDRQDSRHVTPEPGGGET